MLLEHEREIQANEIISALHVWFDHQARSTSNRAESFHSNGQRALGTQREEVAQSWIRSENNPWIPQTQISPKMKLDSILFEKVLKENQQLLELTAPILQEVEKISQKTNSFGIGLLDRNAILLHVKNFPIKQIQPGLNFSEDRVGTSAVAMSLAQNKPVYLLSSEVYNEVLSSSQLILSIPIRDFNRKIVAFFVAPYFQKIRFSPEEKQLFSFLVSWQFATAQRLEEAIRICHDKPCVPGIKLSCHKNATDTNASTQQPDDSFQNIWGQSPEIIKTKAIAKKIACNMGNILLFGESGTGKELFAQAIHTECCNGQPFVPINCGAIPKNLIESELFGYEGGSFTGAERKGRPGKLEIANGGTVFLDEIGDLPLELQPVLLRVLEDKKIIRVGGNRYIPTTFRIIAASNKDLSEMVKHNSFREDLYFRLAALKLVIPPLRKRPADIIYLAEIFIRDACHQANKPVLRMDPAVIRCLLQYPWPGNIRELKNCILWAVTLADQQICAEDLPEEIVTRIYGKIDYSLLSSKQQLIQDLESEQIKVALAECNQNISQAARQLGISRPTLYRKIKSLHTT